MLSPNVVKILADHAAAQQACMAEIAAQQHRTGPTGPRTAEGKARIRLNAYRHGLTGMFRITNPDEQRQFGVHCQAMLTALAPVGPVEQQHAQHIAEEHWRLHRSRITETNIFALTGVDGDPLPKPALPSEPEPEVDEALLDAKTWLAHSKTLSNLTLYQTRIERSIIRNTQALETLQAARRAALEEEVLLAELAESEGETYAPAPNPQHPEFVFSTAQVLQALTRKKRLAKARQRFQPTQKRANKTETL